MLFYKPPVNFSLNTPSPFSVMTRNSSVNFQLKHYILCSQKEPIKVQILRLCSIESKFTIFLVSFFKPQVSFSSNFASFFSTMTHNSSIQFGSNIIHFRQKQNIKVLIFRLATARIKIQQIRHVIFGAKTQFFFKLNITLQCHET